MTELSNPPLNQSLGEIFHQLREQQGYTIHDVAASLRIGKSYIEAIEHNQIDDFPARVYILGFIRSYAKFLKQDPEYFIKRFKEEILKESDSSTSLHFPTVLTSDSSPNKKILLISSGAFMVLFAVGISLWQWTPSKTTLEENLEKDLNIEVAQTSSNNLNVSYEDNSIFDQNPDETYDEEEDPVSLLPTATNLPQNKSAQLTSPSIDFDFIKPTWIKIQNDSGQSLLEKIYQPQDHFSRTPLPGQRLFIGNAGGVQISFSSYTKKVLGTDGQIINNLSLDAVELSAYLSKH